jgi:bacteriorhodopsin
MPDHETTLRESLSVQATRGAESWQFFAFAFGVLVTIAFGLIDELNSKGWRVGLKITAFLTFGYFTLLSSWGRNRLVGLLGRWKVEGPFP